MNYLILDLDNCIANDGWRIPRIRWSDPHPFRRYHEYHLLAPWDVAGNRDLFEGREERILIFTSRPVHYRRATEEWLERAGVQVKHLLMRRDTDYRSSAAVKAEQLRWLPEYYGIELAQITCAYDDREEILRVYRAAGVRAERRWLHDVCAYTDHIRGINHADGEKARQAS